MIKLRILRSDVYLAEPGSFGEDKILLPEKYDVLQFRFEGFGNDNTWHDVPIVEGPDFFRVE